MEGCAECGTVRTIRGQWDWAASDMRRGYYLEGYPNGRSISIHPESGLGQRERNRLGLGDREVHALFAS